MVLEKLFGLFEGRPSGLSIDLGVESSILSGRQLMIRGSGPSMRSFDGGYRWRKRNRRAFILPSAEPNPHMVVSGMSGFGKSMFFKSMLVDIANAGVSCVIFDGHNEHKDVVMGLGGQVHDAGNGGISLLALDGSTVADRIAGLTALLSSVYGLGHIQSTKLGQCLKYTYRKLGAKGGNDRTLNREPRVQDLLWEIQIFIKNAKTASEGATLTHLYSKISNLNTKTFNSQIEGDLKRGIHSFSMSERMSREARLIYLVELLERVYTGMKDDPKDRKVRQYIMIDESQVLINESEECSGVITKFIEEGRKYGRGVIIVTHMSSKLNRQIVANASAFMAFYSREPTEAAYVSKVMTSNFDAELAVRGKLATLGDGEAMIITANRRAPRVVATVGLHKKIEIYHASDEHNILNLVGKPIRLGDLSSKIGIGMDEVRNRLGSSIDRFVDGADEWVMRRSNPGIEHEVMVSKIQSLLSAAGIDSYIHNRANGPDVVAYCKDGKVAIEYETGSKQIDDTVSMLRRRFPGYCRVIVVVNDNRMERYKIALSGIGCTIIPASGMAGALENACRAGDHGSESADAAMKVV